MKAILFFFTLCCSFIATGAGDPLDGEKKATICAACHGAKGLSQNPEWPNLAGQHKTYLIKQINDFKQNQGRSSDVMAPMVSTLNKQDITDIAEFYATLPLPKGETPQTYLKKGEMLYRGGDFEKHITACIACHGPKGTGNAQAGFPVVSGQHAKYLLIQLQQFKHGKRHNDLNSIMQDICARMSKEDMIAVSHYMSGLH